MKVRYLLPLFIFLLPLTLQAQDCLFTEVTLTTHTQDWGEEVSWTLINENGDQVASFSDGVSETTYDTLLCLEDGCYSLTAEDSYGDGWNGGYLEISFDAENFEYALEDGGVGYFYFGINASGCEPIIPGCTDPDALNYDPTATVDDGSCQNIQEVIDAQIFDTIHYSGPKDNRINWVIQNRDAGNPNGNFANQAAFVQAFEDDLFKAFTLGDPDAQTPYASYVDFFNLYAVWWPDAPSDQDWWHFSIIKALRDSIFLPWANEETGWATWFSTTKNGGGGGAGVDRPNRVGDGKMFGMGWETLLHEFGHTMPGLLDEYSASGEWSGGNCWETPNTTGFTDIDEVPWRLWIEPGTPLPTPYDGPYLDKIGAFEGAMTNYFGCHRPTARGCYMGAGGFGEGYGLELCPPCIQRVICFLYKYVNVIENPMPVQTELEVTGFETLHFSAEVLKPNPNTQKYEWILNGKVIATGVEEIDVTFGFCDKYELVFAVTDTNTMVRYDPKFDDTYPMPYREMVWHIDQTDVNSYGLMADYSIQNPDCTGAPNGSIDMTLSGGQPPYSIFLKNEPFGPLTNLAAGEYTLDIVDSNGCGIFVEATLEQTPVLQPQICSEFIDGVWTLSLQTEPYDINDLNILWSTGAESPTISGLSDGTYSVQVATLDGCQVSQSISLNTFEDPLQVDATSFASELNRPTGKIFLDIQGGLPPYTLDWADLPYQDITDTNTDNIQASGTTWDHLPEYAFDDDLGTKWLHFVSQDAWISYQNVSGSLINAYSITSADDVPERDPKDWIVQGSNDGVDWVIIDQRSNEDFVDRFEKRTFSISNPASFNQYRLYITENHGDGSIQLQELEFIGRKADDAFTNNEDGKDHSSRIQLASGSYVYTVKDANQTAVSDTVEIGFFEAFIADGLKVVPDGICQVKIETPDPDYTYYWLPDEEGSAVLEMGTTFQPPASGNYYVAALSTPENGLSTNRKGFAVTMEAAPEIEITPDTMLQIVNPDPDLDYYWYVQESCGDPLHVGTSFAPGTGTGFYYATAYRNTALPDPIAPSDLSGRVLHMDAADLDGDGQVDDPAFPTSSILDWTFEDGNSWNGWFAYRSNHQNGLGIADFATIWLQGFQQGITDDFRTILMAYEENPLSFPETAPLEALSAHIPRHTDASQLFSNNTPSTTLNGTTFLNGEIVDPLTTPNPLEFCILGTRMTEAAGNDIYYTDTQWEGKLGELILWDHALSNAEIEGVSEYLRQKWISTADLESPKTGIYWEYGPSSTYDLPENRNIIVFPNPTSDRLEVKGLEPGMEVRMYSVNGGLVFSAQAEAEVMVWDVQRLLAGIYFLQVVDGENQVILGKKVVKE